MTAYHYDTSKATQVEFLDEKFWILTKHCKKLLLRDFNYKDSVEKHLNF